MNALLVSLALLPGADPDWKADEAQHLENIRTVTKDFARAGEGYFSPDGKQIIFQAEEKETGNPFYQIFVQDLASGKFHRVSPGQGRTTCAYFHPTNGRILFSSSHTDPDIKKNVAAELALRAEEAKTGKRRRYSWDFDPHMKIYTADIDGGNLKCLTPDATVYTAEANYSQDGKKIVYSAGNAGDVQLYVMDADGKNANAITTAKNCYNGGPFFSPDGKKVIFRSDRKEKDRLQIYVVDADGKNEKALTSNDKWVYWAPFWYKDGKHIIYTAADHSNDLAPPNYDVYWMDIDSGKTTRLTYAPGQDVLPVFSPNYKKLMWTTNREGRKPTQLYIADFTPPKE